MSPPPSAYLTHPGYRHPPAPISDFTRLHFDELKSVTVGRVCLSSCVRRECVFRPTGRHSRQSDWDVPAWRCCCCWGRCSAASDDLVPVSCGNALSSAAPRPPRRRRHPGRLPIDNRAALRGSVYVLSKEVSWADVPAGRIGWSKVTCWRRLRDWTQVGV
ncbi:transposase [Streptomyces sp900105245]|uniref:Transposase n=1 Tax=Streptomyces sp. 900105245 TaxID=3154379 RepID=A0ABV1ULK8_9ACTN